MRNDEKYEVDLARVDLRLMMAKIYYNIFHHFQHTIAWHSSPAPTILFSILLTFSIACIIYKTTEQRWTKQLFNPFAHAQSS